jgi:solute carrier family 26 protein 5
MTGVSCHIFTSQVKHLFGVSHGRYTGVFKLVYVSVDIKKIPQKPTLNLFI